MASSIGVKIANGEFYPLVEENSSVKKRLVLTTVHDNQPSVQIDLFRSPLNEMADAQYIGTVVVENIKPKPKGEPSIEMVISSDEDGNIIADAIDLDTGSHGEHYVLTVSLKSMDETSRDMEIQDFELESNEEPPSGLYNHANRIRKQKSKSGMFILLGLLLFLGLLALWLFLFGGLELIRSLDRRVQTVAEVPPQPQPVRTPEPAITAERRSGESFLEPVQVVIQPPPVIQAAPPPPVQPVTASQPVSSLNIPSVIPREGVNYIIRRGDTLWDISEAFYRDPWQYPRIARHNNIGNPNHIIYGRTIRIPPRN